MKALDGGNMISFEKAKHDPNKCSHNRTIVSEELANVTCKDCGKELNPIWVLVSLANAESRYKRTLENYMEQKAAIQKRVRTKCEHCGKMTRIRGF